MNRARIKEQSKQVADYMKKPPKYQVLWTCPHCGNSHNWWWEDEFEAFWDGETHMVCDRCEERVKCVGDGHGYYEPVPGDCPLPDVPIERIEAQIKDLYAGLNALAKRLSQLESVKEPVSPTKGDVWVRDDDPTVMRVFNGTVWIDAQQNTNLGDPQS